MGLWQKLMKLCNEMIGWEGTKWRKSKEGREIERTRKCCLTFLLWCNIETLNKTSFTRRLTHSLTNISTIISRCLGTPEECKSFPIKVFILKSKHIGLLTGVVPTTFLLYQGSNYLGGGLLTRWGVRGEYHHWRVLDWGTSELLTPWGPSRAEKSAKVFRDQNFMMLLFLNILLQNNI